MVCDHFLDFYDDFECGFLVYGCFKQLCQVLGLFLLFSFGFEVLQFSCLFKGLAQFLCGFRKISGGLRSGVYSKCGFYWKYFLKILASRGGLVQLFKNSIPPIVEKFEGTKQETQKSNGDVKANVNYGDDGDEKEERYDEDQVFDVMTLRKLVKLERRRADDACLELEKERVASSSAAEETMARILRLQNEKSLVELEYHQFRRLVEEKQLHDQEVIRSLRWIVMKHESERSLLENSLRHCRQKVKQFKNTIYENQCEESDESFSFLDALDDGLISSLDMGLSPQKMAQLCEGASVENSKRRDQNQRI